MTLNPVRITLALIGFGLSVRGLSARDSCKSELRDPIVLAHVPSRIIIRPQFPFDAFRDLVGITDRRLPGLTVTPLGPDGAFVVDSIDATTEQLQEMFSDSSRYESVEEDAYIEAHGSAVSRLAGTQVKRKEPIDEAFKFPDSRWWLDAIHAPEAWEYGTGNPLVAVAVLDSGIEPNHRDLRDNVFFATHDFQMNIRGHKIKCRCGDFGYDAIDGDCKAEARSDHGSEVAGIIGACGNNGYGVTGVNWDVTLVPVTILDKNDSGCVSRAVKGLEFVRLYNEQERRRVRVINLSWGMDGPSKSMKKELRLLADSGVVIVASAGNLGHDNDDHPVLPASYKDISTLIAVTATGRTFALLGNFGVKSVHIAAPGDGIETTASDLVYRPFDLLYYTSAAAPFVTGAVALLSSQCPDLSGIELRKMILDNADRRDELKDFVNDARFLNIEKALAACESWKNSTRPRP